MRWGFIRWWLGRDPVRWFCWLRRSGGGNAGGGIWILVKASRRMHGVDGRGSGEQWSAGVPEAGGAAARATLTAIIAILIVLWEDCVAAEVLRDHGDGSGAADIRACCRYEGGGRGKGFYDVTMFSVLLVLFVGEHVVCGFSRLCRVVARDDYLRIREHAGRRLVYSQGIWRWRFSRAVAILFGGVRTG